MKKIKKAVGFIFIVIVAAVLWVVCAYAENSCPITISNVEFSDNQFLSVKATSDRAGGFARAIAAFYNEGILTDVAVSNTVTLTQGNIEFKFNNNTKKHTNNQTAKIFIWSSDADGTLTICPLAEKYTIENDKPTDKIYEVETREFHTDNNGQNIYGMAYVPKNAENKVPTVIISHGYGGTSSTNASYAHSLASHGVAAYCFDFRGGSPNSRSDGKTTDMTVFTEVSDLNAVINTVKELDLTDTNNLFLLGTSQGGLVSALTASQRPNEIQGLMLFYPALCISNDARSRYSSINSVPETTYFMRMNVGREYYTSIYDYDIYKNIAGYTDDVLIVHGDRDSIVPISYSEKAANIYNSADLKILSGAGHGFYGQDAQIATDYILEYIKNNISEDDIDTGIRIVPESYNSSARQQGKVETLTYRTSAGTQKTAYVYLPYGYDSASDKRYNILYFMHGGGGNAGQFYNRSYALNDILDHAIENGDIEPLIVVTPTFYPPNDTDSSVSNASQQVSVFHKEFINDLMPAVESHYKTYALSVDTAGLEASRKHRAFGGFSMGSVTTWYQFINSLDYVAYFMPLSGDCWEFGNQGGASHPKETAEYLSNYVSNAKYGKDFYIYAMTGSRDIAYTAMNNQLGAMRETNEFKFGTNSSNGNISFQVLEGATHDYTYYRNYIYTILPYFFKSAHM